MRGKLLVVVDMQKDFVDGALGTKEAQAIVPSVVKKINNWDGDIIVTYDTHGYDYLSTNEGKHLPVTHCVNGSIGHKLDQQVEFAVNSKRETAEVLEVCKPTFGSTALPELIRGLDIEEIEIVGLCTDICVVSNALILKANYPEIPIAVDASCCAGVTPESHNAALTTMKMCQIEVIGE